VLKVTIARWYTPGGKNIDKEGIEPDQKVERTPDDYKNGKDPQKDAAIQFLSH
jgi:C-terminal processing protease CtpA/Prc